MVRDPPVLDAAIPDVMSFDVIECVSDGLAVGMAELLPAE
jgi:hypothetical protein